MASNTYQLPPLPPLANLANVSTTTLLTTLTLLPLLSLLAVLIHRHSRLSHIPGPPLASLTDLYLFVQTLRGIYYNDLIHDLHARYGPVVRWGPSRLSFASAAAIPDIYHGRRVFPKSASYEPMIVVASGKEVKTLITERDERRVSALKRLTVAGFSQSSFLGQEAQIDRVMGGLFAVLRGRVDGSAGAKGGSDDGSGENLGAGAGAGASSNDKASVKSNRSKGPVKVEISDILPYWSFDTINQVAFSDDLGFMAAGTDVGDTFAGVRQRFDHWRTWFALPTLERLLYKNAWARRFPPSKSILAELAMRRVAERRKQVSAGKGASTGASNDPGSDDPLNRDLLGRFLSASTREPSTLSPGDVLGLTISTIHAGSHTIATTSSLILNDLTRHPGVMAKLLAELDAAGISADAIPVPFSAVADLPYLDAVMRETMRWNDLSPNPREKTVTGGGAMIAGVAVPEGTDVSVSDLHVHRDVGVWGEDAERYRPERWVEAGREERAGMERASMGFSQGRRVCVGQHLARIEIKKLVASLLVVFKITASDEEPKIGFHMNTMEVKLKVNMEYR